MKKIITLILILFCLNSSGQINYFFWAHSGGTLYSSAAINAYYTKNNCSAGYQGSTVAVSISAGTYTSYVSQAAADAQAQTAAQDYANANGSCNFIYCNAVQSCEATRNDCPSGYISDGVTYYGVVYENNYSSIVSQADADAQATSAACADAQSIANASGSCVAECTRPEGMTCYSFNYILNGVAVTAENVCTISEFFETGSGVSGCSLGTDGSDCFQYTGCDKIPDGYYLAYYSGFLQKRVHISGGKFYNACP